MKLNKYPITWFGNKYNETKEIIDLVGKYDYIVEPFGGIFGFSRFIYYTQPEHTRFLINDIDKKLIDVHILIKERNPNELIQQCMTIFKEIQDMKDTDAQKYVKANNNKSPIHSLLYLSGGDNFLSYVNTLKRKIENYIHIDELKKILNRCDFYCMGSFDFIKMVEKINGTKLIYLDPPYFDSSNKSYCFGEKVIDDNRINIVDNTQMYIDIYKLLVEPPKDTRIIYVMNHSAIINFIFEKYEKRRYYKVYQAGFNKGGIKRKTIHIVYTN